jgi:long-chain acyl-CoA synthetase
MKRDNISEEQLGKIIEDARKTVNQQVPEFMTVAKVRVHPEEFAKTPKRSIKRFLYTKE